jgi:hypothetical protein
MSVNYGDFAEIDLRGAPDTAPAFDDGAGPQEVLDELARRINDRLGSPTIACEWVPVNADNTGVGFIRIVPIDSSSSDRRSVRVERADDNDMTEALMLGVKQGGIEPSQYSILRPAPTGTVLGTDGVFTESGSDIPLAYQPQDAFNQITVNAPRFTIDLGTALGTGGRWYQDSGGGYDGIRERIALIAEAIDAAPDLPFEAKIWKHFGHRYHLVLLPEQLERAGAELNVTTSGGAGVDIGGLFRTGPCLYALDGGDSGSALQPADYLGSELDQTGMYALDPVDQFNLMVIPEDRDIDEAGYQRIIQRASTYCRAKRAFLLADPPASWTTPAGRPAVDRTVVDNFRTGLATTYAAVFYPRVLVTENGVNRSVGASAMVAGLMARTDVAKGVWKAPAGIDAYLSGLSGPAVNLTDRENGVLNKLGVNCLRSMAGRVVNWGARTLDGDDRMASQWKYIPVRRLALFIEESLYRGTHWVVFEPNDEPLWANIRMNVGAFMHGLFRRGAFQGGTPDKAYFVRCDETTTTRADRNRGVVNIEVGFAPLKPAEFVVIKIQQIAGNLV